MGCRLSKKNDSESTTNSSSTMPRNNREAMDSKAKLEKKLCLAKETPEPEFDLSDCLAKTVPSGVFIMCRVLRKETLDLSKNKLQTLNDGGLFSDLLLLRTLNLSFNNIRQLPDDINKLENLRELFVSNNQLVKLTKNINQLHNLELLDISHNQLTDISDIKCMAHLRILNIAGNVKLNKLPKELSTCDSLVDIILDANIVLYPPQNVIELGTLAILNFLTTGDVCDAKRSAQANDDNNKASTNNPINDVVLFAPKIEKIEQDKLAKEKLLLEQEKALEMNTIVEAELHQRQQKRREELLHQLKVQQVESDSLVSKLQHEKDSERNKLIGDILKAEQNSTAVVEQLLSLRSTENDMILIEQENQEQNKILEQLRINNSDLRKQDVLSAMTNILAKETRSFQSYHNQRDASARDILLRECESNQLLSTALINKDRDRTNVVVKIMQDEELQKIAVASLIERNDSRTWGLMEQVRIVESQLAAMTHLEIERRKLSVDGKLNEFIARRLDLTNILMDLLAQQEKRKKQLLQTLEDMEEQKTTQHEDFWLLQYQKLLDSQPSELSDRTANLDPALAQCFLINGVVHCLPFLSKIWQNKQNYLADITEDDLRSAGIKQHSDRFGILKSIEDYLLNANVTATAPSDEQSEKVTNDTVPSEEPAGHSNATKNSKLNDDDKLPECVICMEESCKIIFVPCGHLCCCLNCHIPLKLCPMCRTQIERRVKVIQV